MKKLLNLLTKLLRLLNLFFLKLDLASMMTYYDQLFNLFLKNKITTTEYLKERSVLSKRITKTQNKIKCLNSIK